MAFNLNDFHRPCSIGFRVEVHDAHHRARNWTIRENGDMRARCPARCADATAVRDHLSWRRTIGPFISFFTNWNMALNRWRRMIQSGASNVVIVAVWLRGLPVYDAFDLARTLNFQSTDVFLYEVLLHASIPADSYRLLAVFCGRRGTTAVLCTGRLQAEITMPEGFVSGVTISKRVCVRCLPDISERLRDELYMRTGGRDDLKLLFLVLAIVNVNYVCQPGIAGTIISCPPYGIGWHIDRRG